MTTPIATKCRHGGSGYLGHSRFGVGCYPVSMVRLMAGASMGQVFFTDRSAPGKKHDPLMANAWYSDDNFERKKRTIELANKKGVLPINIALAYVLDQPFPTFALICPYTLDEMRTTMDALKITLSPQEIQWLNLKEEERKEV